MKKDLHQTGQKSCLHTKHTKPVMYTIEDTSGEEVHGTFYEPELHKTKQEIYRIEKVLNKCTKSNGIKEVYVKWRGYNNDFHSWIPLTDLQQQQQPQ